MSLSDSTLDPPTEPAPPPARTSIRPLVMRLHFYAGLLVAPFILIAAVTGGLYAAAPTLEKIVYGHLLTVDPGGAPLPVADQVAAARATAPDLHVSTVRPPSGPQDSTRVSFTDPTLPDDTLRSVFVDPYTARVLGSEPTWFGYLPLSTWLDGLHRHLHLGEPGRVYSELAASWLWVIALGGLYLWVVRPAASRLAGRLGRRSRTVRTHSRIGVWALIMLLFLSATGITWSTYAGAHVSDIRAALHWQRPALDAPAAEHVEHAEHAGHVAPAPDPASIDYSGVLAAADAAGVHAPVEVTVPAEAGGPVTVSEIDKAWRLTTNVAAIDPQTLHPTGTISYWSDYSVVAMLADWGIRMHMGFLFGLANQILLLAVAAAVVVMIVLGYRMWWQRRPIRGGGWGRPPARGAWRALPVAARVALPAGAVVLVWFLPVFGVSLIGFLLVDAVVGMLARRRAQRLT